MDCVSHSWSYLQRVAGLFSGGLNAASTLSSVIVVLYGANLTINGSMTIGYLTSFVLYSLTGTSSIFSSYDAALKGSG